MLSFVQPDSSLLRLDSASLSFPVGIPLHGSPSVALVLVCWVGWGRVVGLMVGSLGPPEWEGCGRREEEGGHEVQLLKHVACVVLGCSLRVVDSAR